MIISMIAAMSEDRVIGRAGELPWHIPEDLARFRAITIGHTIIMGRKTYEGIGQPLEGRTTVVLSRTLDRIEGCQVVRSLAEAIEAGEGDEEIFICGGSEIFLEALPIAQRIYLTLVHGKFKGDAFFPEIPDSFLELHREEVPDTSPPVTFLVYEKVGRISPNADAEELRQKGLEALQRKLYFLARRCLEQALTMMEDPELSSHLAFCMAKSGCDRSAALRLAEQAQAAEPENLTVRFNLGRVQMMAGRKEQGLATLRKGVQLGGGKEYLTELAQWGSRTPPPIPSLPRSHPLNRYLGMMMHRLGLK